MKAAIEFLKTLGGLLMGLAWVAAYYGLILLAAATLLPIGWLVVLGSKAYGFVKRHADVEYKRPDEGI